jgi:hypothetical protein
MYKLYSADIVIILAHKIVLFHNIVNFIILSNLLLSTDMRLKVYERGYVQITFKRSVNL